jgi:hypothetical protein
MLNEKEYTVSVLRANLAALIFCIPIIVLSVFTFIFFWSWKVIFNALDVGLVYVILVIVPGVFMHEFLHGFTWSIFAKKGWRSIVFGFKWESLTPYCHCKEPLKKRHYLLGTSVPFLLMGLIPIVFSIMIGSGIVLLIGLLFCISAGGDIYGVWMLRNARRNNWIQDHPDQIGFIVLG